MVGYNPRVNQTDRIVLPAALPVLPVLHGARLDLRAMQDGDAASLFDIYGDPLVMRYTDEPPFPGMETVAVMLDSVRRLLAHGLSLEWAIVLNGTGQVIGTCGLHSFGQARREAEVGCLLRRSAWGGGYMAEALGLLMGFAGGVLRLRRLTADVAPANGRAQRLFSKLGYRPDRTGLLAIDLNK